MQKKSVILDEENKIKKSFFSTLWFLIFRKTKLDDINAILAIKHSISTFGVIYPSNYHFQNIHCNADMGTNEIRIYCVLDNAGRDLLKLAMTKLGLSARAYDRILKVSRTIADIEGEEDIQVKHISEAIQYRSLDRELWMH